MGSTPSPYPVPGRLGTVIGVGIGLGVAVMITTLRWVLGNTCLLRMMVVIGKVINIDGLGVRLGLKGGLKHDRLPEGDGLSMIDNWLKLSGQLMPRHTLPPKITCSIKITIVKVDTMTINPTTDAVIRD